MSAVVVMNRTPRLGAIELIELGRPASSQEVFPHRRPYLASRAARLGILDFIADVGSFLSGLFEFLFHTLADIVNVPLDLASQGVGVLFDGVAGFLANVPVLGELAAQLLLVGKAVIQWGLSVPGMLLEGIGNIFGEVKAAIDAVKSPGEAKADESAAEKELLKRAKEKGGEELENAVKDALVGKKPEGATNVPDPKSDAEVDELASGAGKVGPSSLTGSDLGDKILTIGVPVAAATGLALVVLS